MITLSIENRNGETLASTSGEDACRLIYENVFRESARLKIQAPRGLLWLEGPLPRAGDRVGCARYAYQSGRPVPLPRADPAANLWARPLIMQNPSGETSLGFCSGRTRPVRKRLTSRLPPNAFQRHPANQRFPHRPMYEKDLGVGNRNLYSQTVSPAHPRLPSCECRF